MRLVLTGHHLGGGELERWIHLAAIRALVFHATAVLTTLVLSAVVCFVIQRLMHEGPFKRLMILIDELLTLVLILFFVVELGVYFWPK
jgi:hypothetical protein